jgi:modification methylase
MIYNQDCLEWMQTQPSDSIDTIIFSPPYNKKGFRGGVRTSTKLWDKANIDYALYDDNMPESDYQAWQIDIVNECHRLIKPSGSIFYQHKIRNWDRKGSHPMEWLSKTQAQFYQEIVWHRKSTMALDERYLFSTTERIYWFCKQKPKVFKQQVAEQYRSDVWVIAPEKQQGHPAPFPPQLVENCLLLTTQPGDIVYDPFLGSGTTLLVAEQLDRQSIGTEIDVNYIQLAEERLKVEDNFKELFE